MIYNYNLYTKQLYSGSFINVNALSTDSIWAACDGITKNFSSLLKLVFTFFSQASSNHRNCSDVLRRVRQIDCLFLIILRKIDKKWVKPQMFGLVWFLQVCFLFLSKQHCQLCSRAYLAACWLLLRCLGQHKLRPAFKLAHKYHSSIATSAAYTALSSVFGAQVREGERRERFLGILNWATDFFQKKILICTLSQYPCTAESLSLAQLRYDTNFYTQRISSQSFLAQMEQGF